MLSFFFLLWTARSNGTSQRSALATQATTVETRVAVLFLQDHRSLLAQSPNQIVGGFQ